MKIGVYVGSFNPPHKGHITIVRNILKSKIVDKILIIPTNNYWNKTNIIDLKHRINMLNFYKSKNIIINNTLNNLEYTYQVFRELEKDNNEYSLILGADNIISFDKWKNYEELLQKEIIIIDRNNLDIKSYLNKLNKKDKYHIVNIKNINISSTYIRENINNEDNIINLIDKEILDYIKKENLYS